MAERNSIKKFVDDWKDRGKEKSDTQMFWSDLLGALGIETPSQFMQFEAPIDVDGNKCWIDAWIDSTRVLIEQKSRGIDLDKPARQSDGKFLTPFEQAKRYADALDYSQHPKWIVVCNFVELRVYNMNVYYRRREESYQPNVIYVDRLEHDAARLNFLIDPNDENVDPSIKISKQAIKLIKLVYDALEKQCVIINSQCVIENPSSNYELRITNYALKRQLGIRNAELGIETSALNYELRITHYELSRFCVRLMFCLYADDADIFAPKQFARYFKAAEDRQAALVELFRILDTPKPRPSDLRAELADFPYVNGDLFRDAADSVPSINDAANHYILAAAEFDWIDVSPPIFGAMFESILNPDNRRKGGMHYTSVENIHRVIDPLFLDDLHSEFHSARRKSKANRRHALEAFQLKLASLRFFDPACGSGNFLTETYIAIRTLENETIAALRALGAPCEVLVSIENFYGIEINNFAVAVARTALWIAENQMLKRTASILEKELDFLPLTSAAHITQGNALRLDWNEIAPSEVDYIIGNPPFVGTKYQTAAQKADILAVCKELKSLDFVTGWFKKAADFMIGTETRAAFVSTNSITQGEQVAPLWKVLDAHIDFAYRTFKWLSESEDMAAVHCVIIGFSHAPNKRLKLIIDGDRKLIARNINGYLLDAPDISIEKRKTPICDVPPMNKGSQPTDGGNLLLSAAEREQLIAAHPDLSPYIKRYMGADDLINGKMRYCLWLKDCPANVMNASAEVMRRLECVRQSRLSSRKAATRAWADRPHLFTEDRQPDRDYIMLPVVSSENRRYLPIDYVSCEVIANANAQMLPDAELFHFGVLTSSTHMAWMRAICGRLEMRYAYSASIVYNNFVWCPPSPAIERTAQSILDVRGRYPDRSLASLYDEETMPSELRAAHLENDLAVLDAYGFSRDMSESEIVSRLMEMYERLKKTVDDNAAL